MVADITKYCDMNICPYVAWKTIHFIQNPTDIIFSQGFSGLRLVASIVISINGERLLMANVLQITASGTG